MQSHRKAPHARAASRDRRPRGDAVEELIHELRVQQDEMMLKNRELSDAWSALERTVAHYEDLYDNAPVAYIILDGHGVVLDLNLTAVKLFGIERERLLERPFLLLVREGDHLRFLDHLRRCRHAGSATTEIHVALDGTTFPVEIDSRQTARREGEGISYRTAVIDLRERQRMERARERAEEERHHAEERERAMRIANEEKDRFLAELSHELRTPLTPVLAAVSILKQRRDIPESVVRQIEMIERNIAVEARLIDDLLDVSRIGRDRFTLDFTSCDVHEVLRDVAPTLEAEIRSREVAFAVELNARDPVVRGDSLRLHQVFWNLVRNALQSTRRGGSVVVASSNIDRDVRVAVRDTGVGIERDQLERIFAPFVHGEGNGAQRRANRNGLGLGLAIVKGIVDAHGGRIRAFSEGRDCGATFIVELPTASSTGREEPPERRLATVPERPADAQRPEGERVLIVEDHADTREALKICLELEGYRVRVASDVASAIAAAREPVDVLVCDISLPDGSGLDVIRGISRDHPVKAIALTGYGTARDAERSFAAGFAAHLTKPVAAEKLVAAIASLREAER